MLVMTATPIPRTLALSLYGDLDISIIDELPPGRKPITTKHLFEKNRLKLNGFMQQEIAKGRQVYIVFPLIEESETLDLKNLELVTNNCFEIFLVHNIKSRWFMDV